MAGLQVDRDIDVGLAEAKLHEADLEKKENASEPSTHEPELDGIHDGLIFPTDEERETLRRMPDDVPWNAFLIAFVEGAERFSYYGSTVVFTNFIQQPMPNGSTTGASEKQPGALGFGQRAATAMVTFNAFWVYVIPLFGAYIADTRWGRFKTVCIAVCFALVGHIILLISAIPPVLEKPSGAMACFVIAIIVMGLGTGGFKSNISPLVAEQYKRTKQFIGTTKSGERVILDPALTSARIYMYFYLFTNVGALVGQISMAYAERFVGFYLSFTLPTAVFLLCPIVLFAGNKRYVKSPPQGSVLGKALRIWRAGMQGKWSLNPIKTAKALNAPDFWDHARPSQYTEETRPKWMTFDDVWVDEVKRGFKACAVFLYLPIYWLTYNQLNSNLVSQAATLNTHKLPNDILSNLDPLALIICIPIVDRVIYPALRRAGFRFTALKRMSLGFFSGSIAMIWAAVVQHYVYKTSPCGNQAATCKDENGDPLTSPLNVWIQTGSYLFIAFSEILTIISGLEYAFTKAPKNMRSLVMSVFLFMNAISSALGFAFVSLAEDPLLIWNYGVFAVLAFLAGTFFWLQFRHLDAAEEELNALGAGQVKQE